MNDISIWDKRPLCMNQIVITKHFKSDNGGLKAIAIPFSPDISLGECIDALERYYRKECEK